MFYLFLIMLLYLCRILRDLVRNRTGKKIGKLSSRMLRTIGKEWPRNFCSFILVYVINPEPAEFLSWNNPSSILELSIIIFRDIKMRIWNLPASSIEPDVQAGLALYWWQWLITVSSSRIRVKKYHSYYMYIVYI